MECCQAWPKTDCLINVKSVNFVSVKITDTQWLIICAWLHGNLRQPLYWNRDAGSLPGKEGMGWVYRSKWRQLQCAYVVNEFVHLHTSSSHKSCTRFSTKSTETRGHRLWCSPCFLGGWKRLTQQGLMRLDVSWNTSLSTIIYSFRNWTLNTMFKLWSKSAYKKTKPFTIYAK